MNVQAKILLYFIILGCESWTTPIFNGVLILSEAVPEKKIVAKQEIIKLSDSQLQTSNSDKMSTEQNTERSQNGAQITTASKDSTITAPFGRYARSVHHQQPSTTNSINTGATRQANKPFFLSSTHVTRTNKLWLPLSVSEIISSDDWYGNKATVTYRPNIRSLQNITKATLNVTTRLDESTSNVPILLFGHFYLVGNETSVNSTQTPALNNTLGSLIPSDRDSTGISKVSFDISNFIRSASLVTNTAPASEKVTIVFIVRRQCNSIVHCPLIIQTGSGLPFLKVDYRRNN